RRLPPCSFFCLFRDRPTTEIYPLSLHDALPISGSSADHGASPDLPKTVPIPPTSRGFGLLFPKNPEISMKSHRTLRRALAVGLAALTAALVFTACKKTDSHEIVIGEFGALTGPIASFGQSTHKGVTFAVDELNAAGGVLGKPIRLIVEDDQGKPEEALTAVTKLISKDRVVAL